MVGQVTLNWGQILVPASGVFRIFVLDWIGWYSFCGGNQELIRDRSRDQSRKQKMSLASGANRTQLLFCNYRTRNNTSSVFVT